jgi:hypothetical protein
MNSEEQFERGLKRVPVRRVPPEWREGILGAARAERGRSAEYAVPGQGLLPSLVSRLIRQLAALLWPHPKAWGALGAVWVLVLGLNWASRDAAGASPAPPASAPSAQVRALLKQQEQLLAELVGPRERVEAERPKAGAPQPRSQRRTSCEFRVAGWKGVLANFQLSTCG